LDEKEMKIKWILFPLLGGLLLSASADPLTFSLAKELMQESLYDLSAVEFRRFALESEQPAEKAAAYLYSSYAYLQSDDARSSSEMLDRAENVGNTSGFIQEHTLLSAECARLARDTDTALYFYDVLSADSDSLGVQTFSRRRSASLYISRGNLDAARKELERSPSNETDSLKALDVFANGSDKKPFIGGLLGLFPGAGYWYSGETANGFRSLILNGLFMYGMAHTIQEEQWGALAIISFFEITWYSGSIYGGVDSAQRFNKDRRDILLNQVEGSLSFEPDPGIMVPIFKLNIHF
jgi:hypothetical protein